MNTRVRHALTALLTAAAIAASGAWTATPAHAGTAAGLRTSELRAVASVPDLVWPPTGAVRPSLSADALRRSGARMSAHLDRFFPLLVPTARAVSWAPWGGEIGGVVEDGQDYLITQSRHTDPLGRTGVAVEVFAPAAFGWGPRELCALPDTACSAYTLPDRSTLVVQDSWFTSGAGVNRLRAAVHYRNDGSLTRVTGYNYDPNFDAHWDPTVRPDINLTTWQLAALAVDPALTV
ncbi:hypothetical protein [Kitasatospora sp. NPDC004289]